MGFGYKWEFSRGILAILVGLVLIFYTQNAAADCDAFQYKCPCRDLQNGPGPECISINQTCDGRPDCYRGGDEHVFQECDCENGFKCNDTKKCIPPDWRCDAIQDCADNSDEAGDCPVYVCGDGSCIPAIWKCDHYDDCPFGEDEIDCVYTCASDQYQCNDGSCIPASWECDYYRDCPGQEDEAQCPCAPEDFVCSGNGACTPPSWICDADNDCLDGGDEKICNCSSVQYGCHNGNCISAGYWCDGDNDCGDDSDEPDGCTCHDEFQFTCPSGKCIPDSWFCDKWSDCPSGIDEDPTICPATQEVDPNALRKGKRADKIRADKKSKRRPSTVVRDNVVKKIPKTFTCPASVSLYRK